MLALHAVRDPELHVVAQIIEAELVVGAVGDVGAVGRLAFLVVQVVHDHADVQAQELVEAAHPFRVALGQVIVDRDHVDALAGKRVEVARQRGDQRLAFAGFHFGDLALVQHHAANQLHVEMAHVEDAAAGLAHHREGFDQQIVQRCALRDLFFEFDGFRRRARYPTTARIAGSSSLMAATVRQHLFDFAFVLGSENLCQDLSTIMNGLSTGGGPQILF